MQEKTIDHHPFWKRAKEYATANGGWAEVKRNSKELEAWAKYFRAWLRWMPWSMKLMLDHRLEMVLMPAQWPEWYDADFAAADPSEIELREQRFLAPKPWARQNLSANPRGGFYEMVAKHGRPLGRFEQGTRWERLVGRVIDGGRADWNLPLPSQEAAE